LLPYKMKITKKNRLKITDCVEYFLNLFQNHEEKEPFGPGCRDYFWLICHLIDGITKEDVELSWEQVCNSEL